MLKIRFVVRSHMGLVRLSNEDNIYYAGTYRSGTGEELSEPYADAGQIDSPGALFAVCDGMGGEAYGEEASYIAVSELEPLEKCLLEEGLRGWSLRMQEYLEKVNLQICDRIRYHDGQRMGTTLASLFVRGTKAQVTNLGDSRVYRLRDKEFKQLSTDHTQAQRLADLGIIDPSEVRRHPERHRLLQHLGIFPSETELRPYQSEPFDLAEQDLYLLCSDGLSDSIDHKTLRAALLAEDQDLERISDELVDEALEQGGYDNITFIMLLIEDLGEPSSFDDKPVSEDLLPKAKPAPSVTEIPLSEAEFLDDTIKHPIVEDSDEDLGNTRPLTDEFIQSMRATSMDEDVELELGTLPQLSPVRIDDEEDEFLHELENTSTEDTITPPESSDMDDDEGNDGVDSSSGKWTSGRVFSQPITTDDLERFRQAREESLRRQQAYEQEQNKAQRSLWPQWRQNKREEEPEDQKRQTLNPQAPAPNAQTVNLQRGNRQARPSKLARFWGNLKYFLAALLAGFILTFIALNLGYIF